MCKFEQFWKTTQTSLIIFEKKTDNKQTRLKQKKRRRGSLAVFQCTLQFLCLFQIYGNNCITILSSPALPVCLNTHSSPIYINCLDLQCEHVGAANYRMRIPCGIVLSENGRIPACLTFLTVWYLWVLSLWHLLFRLLLKFLLVSVEGEQGSLLFHCPFWFRSCLKLYESPREHWPLKVH